MENEKLMCAREIRMKNCVVCNKPLAGSTIKNVPNVCVSCGGDFCKNMFTGFPKSTCGVAFVCMNCLKRLEPAERQEQVRKQITNMLVVFNVVAGATLVPVILGMIVMFSGIRVGDFSLVFSTFFTGLVLMFSAIGFLLPWSIAFPYAIRRKAVALMGVPG